MYDFLRKSAATPFVFLASHHLIGGPWQCHPRGEKGNIQHISPSWEKEGMSGSHHAFWMEPQDQSPSPNVENSNPGELVWQRRPLHSDKICSDIPVLPFAIQSNTLLFRASSRLTRLKEHPTRHWAMLQPCGMAIIAMDFVHAENASWIKNIHELRKQYQYVYVYETFVEGVHYTRMHSLVSPSDFSNVGRNIRNIETICYSSLTCVIWRAVFKKTKKNRHVSFHCKSSDGTWWNVVAERKNILSTTAALVSCTCHEENPMKDTPRRAAF